MGWDLQNKEFTHGKKDTPKANKSKEKGDRENFLSSFLWDFLVSNVCLL